MKLFNISAETIARALKGRKSGNNWIAHCPAHHDRKPSLSICDADDGKVLVYCRADCTQNAVIDALRQRGLWQDGRPRKSKRYAKAPVKKEPDCDDAQRTKDALKIWQSAKPAGGTVVETYLRSRGLHLPWSQSIRFCPRLKHQPSDSAWPAMVSLVTLGIDDTQLAIQRTFLAVDGSGKAPVDPQRMMLGPCRGGAVRLAPAGDVLMVGEGIESCLAGMHATGVPAWAALSTSGLRTLDLPDAVRDVIILADGDEPGETAARNAALRWKGEGRSVRIARPIEGQDFNDMLLDQNPDVRGDKK
jgi:putative DNA primase/helicase